MKRYKKEAGLSAKVKAPVVVLRFRVAGADGEIACHSAELTVAEFEVNANETC